MEGAIHFQNILLAHRKKHNKKGGTRRGPKGWRRGEGRGRAQRDGAKYAEGREGSEREMDGGRQRHTDGRKGERQGQREEAEREQSRALLVHEQAQNASHCTCIRPSCHTLVASTVRHHK